MEDGNLFKRFLYSPFSVIALVITLFFLVIVYMITQSVSVNERAHAAGAEVVRQIDDFQQVNHRLPQKLSELSLDKFQESAARYDDSGVLIYENFNFCYSTKSADTYVLMVPIDESTMIWYDSESAKWIVP